ncbi:ATP-dependent helicase [Clostridium sp. 19966]|uniref:ATP-dependent helicase n=1 Tax=Clostridium sp. 19966 TaxID=2768166 RepID=UPI0028DF87B9|nr:ATP-dependent helicase [Clostridium sp. 19966]MDT8718884.1 ATP-dependent helicase [Clostridium sp. 19966]
MNKYEIENEVGKILCNKNSHLTCDECFLKNNDTYEICRYAKHCRISEKTQKQLQYISASINENTFLEACPGSGKTEVVGMKAAYEIKRWDNSSKRGIAILTFTNDATDVIKERINQFSKKATFYPHFIGTLSSFIYQYIAQPFGYSEINYTGKNGDHSLRLIDSDLSIFSNPWLQKYKCSIPYISKSGRRSDIYAHQILFDWSKKNFYIKIDQTCLSIGEYYESEQMQNHIIENRKKYNNSRYYSNSYFYNEFRKCKDNFLKDGFVTYEDMNSIAYQVLDKEKIAQKISTRFPLVIVDECQDLSWVEIEILNKLRQKGTILHFVGDINQSIFEFKEVALDSQYTSHYLETFKHFELTDNFRSCQPIVDLSNKLINSDNKVRGIEENKFLENSILYLEYNTVEKVINEYLKILSRFGISQDKCCIIVKQNSLKNQILGNKDNDKEHLLISAIQLWEKGGPSFKKKSLEYAGKQISKWFEGGNSKSNYYCPKDIISSFAWRIFLRDILLDCIINTKLTNYNRKYGKWYEDARKELPSIIKKNYLKIQEYDKIERDFDKIFSSRWYIGKNIRDDIFIFSKESKIDNLVKISTVHGAKGCTYDSTLVVSSKTINSESGHWKKHWIEGTDEDRRIGYVASTRAKFLMIWAVPQLSKEERKLIESYGFKDGKNIV